MKTTRLKGPFRQPAADEARWLLPSGRTLANLARFACFQAHQSLEARPSTCRHPRIALADRVGTNGKSSFSRPARRLLRIPPMTPAQPKHSPIRLRNRWLMAQPGWREVRPSMADERWLVFCATCDATLAQRSASTQSLVSWFLSALSFQQAITIPGEGRVVGTRPSGCRSASRRDHRCRAVPEWSRRRTDLPFNPLRMVRHETRRSDVPVAKEDSV